MTSNRQWACRAVEFVSRIGIDVMCAPVRDSHIPYVSISDGGLVVDLDKVFPGDVLHEAGHLAVVPQPFRSKANGDLADVQRAMGRHLEIYGDRGLGGWPEDPVCRALLQCGEAEAIAWQYAAARAIDLPEEWLFPEASFDDAWQSLLIGLKLGSHMGIHGLQAAGWTSTRPGAATPAYPELAFWLHPGAGEPIRAPRRFVSC